jgi:hypothetical protein
MESPLLVIINGWDSASWQAVRFADHLALPAKLAEPFDGAGSVLASTSLGMCRRIGASEWVPAHKPMDLLHSTTQS